MPGTSQQYDYNDQIQQNDDEISIVAEIEPQPRPVLQQIGNDKQPLFPGKGYRLDGKWIFDKTIILNIPLLYNFICFFFVFVIFHIFMSFR